MNSQSRVLIAKQPSFAVAAIDLARVIQIVWVLFNQITVNGNQNRQCLSSKPNGQIIHSSIKVEKIMKEPEFWHISSTNMERLRF